MIEAEYETVCGACGHMIRPGQAILAAATAGWGDGWVHSQCPRPAPVCSQCWLEQPCECE